MCQKMKKKVKDEIINFSLSDEAIRDYIEIFVKEFSGPIEFDDAKLQATEFLETIKMLFTTSQ